MPASRSRAICRSYLFKGKTKGCSRACSLGSMAVRSLFSTLGGWTLLLACIVETTNPLLASQCTGNPAQQSPLTQNVNSDKRRKPIWMQRCPQHTREVRRLSGEANAVALTNVCRETYFLNSDQTPQVVTLIS